MKFLGFESSRADPDVWMRESVCGDGFTKYYEYVLLYTDDCLVIINLGDCVLRDEIGNYFNLKEAYINAPSSFASQSLNEKEIKSAEEYQTVFLTPDFTYCDRYDTSYKLNEY